MPSVSEIQCEEATSGEDLGFSSLLADIPKQLVGRCAKHILDELDQWFDFEVYSLPNLLPINFIGCP